MATAGDAQLGAADQAGLLRRLARDNGSKQARFSGSELHA
jgi:hypothetical protein